MDAIFGPFCKVTRRAFSLDKGGSNKGSSTVGFFGLFTFGARASMVRGSVMTSVNTEAAAVSGLHKKTRSSLVPERPGKLRGVVRKLFRPVAGACPIPIHPLQPA